MRDSSAVNVPAFRARLVRPEGRVGVDLGEGQMLSVRKENLELLVTPTMGQATPLFDAKAMSDEMGNNCTSHSDEMFQSKKKTKSKKNKYTDAGFNRQHGSSSGGVACTVCNLRDPNTKARICAGCKSVSYCSKACQNTDWKNGHKQKCKIMQAKKPAPT